MVATLADIEKKLGVLSSDMIAMTKNSLAAAAWKSFSGYMCSVRYKNKYGLCGYYEVITVPILLGVIFLAAACATVTDAD
jgi:hypothetical protein